jgi:RHS repeat-associated protein
LGVFTYNLRYPGQYFDGETGLNYNYQRDGYDSQVGRYTQFDPLGLGGGMNGFSYVDNNPVQGVDPLGLLTRGDGLTNRQWIRVQAAENKIRAQAGKSCSCPKSGGASCIPCDVISGLLSALSSSVVNAKNIAGECGHAPVWGRSITITPDGFSNPGCSCLALTIYHELLHNAGLSHNDPGDRVTTLDINCRGDLCK